MNTIDGEISDGVFSAGVFTLPIEDQPDGPVVLGICPEQLVFRSGPNESTITFDLGALELVEPDTLLFIKCGDASLVARFMHDVG